MKASFFTSCFIVRVSFLFLNFNSAHSSGASLIQPTLSPRTGSYSLSSLSQNPESLFDSPKIAHSSDDLMSQVIPQVTSQETSQETSQGDFSVRSECSAF